jgi:hypothetical protein
VRTLSVIAVSSSKSRYLRNIRPLQAYFRSVECEPTIWALSHFVPVQICTQAARLTIIHVSVQSALASVSICGDLVKHLANRSVGFAHMTVTLYAHPRGVGICQNPGLYGNRTLTFSAPRLNPLLPPKPAPAKKNGLNFANPSSFFIVHHTLWRREPLPMGKTATSCFSVPNVGHFSPHRRLLLASWL